MISLFPSEAGPAMLREKGFIRVKEAAALLGVSPNTVRAWGAEGKIPEYRHPANNYRLYKRDELQQVVEQVEASVVEAIRRKAKYAIDVANRMRIRQAMS